MYFFICQGNGELEKNKWQQISDKKNGILQILYEMLNF